MKKYDIDSIHDPKKDIKERIEAYEEYLKWLDEERKQGRRLAQNWRNYVYRCNKRKGINFRRIFQDGKT